MSIVVTPIPQLIELAAPAFTLGTANAAGSAGTAVASDSTLLAFDTSTPTAVSAAGAVGSATTAPRRDHAHAAENISCGAYNDADQSIGTGSLTAVALNTDLWDTDSMHDPTTNNSRMTFTTAGIYVLNAQIQWSNNSSGRRETFIKFNGGDDIMAATELPASGDGSIPQNLCAIYEFDADDYVEIIVYQNSGSSVNLQSPVNSSKAGANLRAVRVG